MLLPWAGVFAMLLPAGSPRPAEALPPVLPAYAAKLWHEEARLARLVASVDAHFEAFWAGHKLVPADKAADGEFLRRASLDLVGRVPTAREARDYLADTVPGKEARAVRRLLASPEYAKHFTTTYRHLWVPQLLDIPNFQFGLGAQFDEWIGNHLAADTPFDRVIRELLTAPTLFANGAQPATDVRRTAFVFNQVNEFKPESVAAGVSRLFMGVKLECCQCHDHPFQKYKREQFWETAAFFAEVQPIYATVTDQKLKRQIKIPDTARDRPGPLLRRQAARLAGHPLAAPDLRRLAPGRRQPVLRQAHGQPRLESLLRHRPDRPDRRAGG